jgi:membrane protease YdiL (CAAX protease family)
MLLCCVFALYYAHDVAAFTGMVASFVIGIGIFPQIISDLGDLISTVALLFLLLLGYGVMARWLNGHRRPLVMMGLQFREGWQREWAIGAALGWGIIVVAVLPMALVGALHFSFALTTGTVWLLAVNTAVLLLAALAQEIIYRGYPFQRLIEAIGPMAATTMMVLFFGVEHWRNSDHSMASTLVMMLYSLLLALAYLRTRALWLVWGLHFAWNFSEGVLFGLPVGGFTRFATIIQTDTIGPQWLTGGDFGPEATGAMVVALIAGIVVLVRVTKDYNWKYNAPVILPGGIPMDVAPPASHTAMEQAAAATVPLVQILPVGGNESGAEKKE